MIYTTIPCKVEGCLKLVNVKKYGLCVTHYNRFRIHGHTNLICATKNCDICGTEFSVFGSSVITSYCSLPCRAKGHTKKNLARASTAEYMKRYKWAHRLRKYSMTPEQYEDVRAKQGGRCSICDRHETELEERLVIDHCHKTNVMRGLLCRLCNVSLGGFRDNPDMLLRAASYLHEFERTRNEVGKAVMAGDNQLEVVA